MNRDEKSATIAEIAAQIEGSEAIFAVDYRGISVPQAAELRSKLREADASFRVVKNRLTKLAADKAGEERLAELLTGPTALTFVRGDTALAAKTISNFNREHEVLAFKGGFMDGLSLDEDKFKSISRLPSRDVLNGQLAGVVASPLTGLVRGFGSMIQGLALQLGQIAEKGLVGGGAASAGTDQGSDASTAGPVAEDAPPANTPEEAPSTPPAEDAAEPEASAEEGDVPAESPEEAAETAESDSAEASDEVAGQDDKGSQGDGATADGGGSEAEQPADSSDKEKEE